MKFSIRDLLLVTAIVALAFTWWVDHRQTSIQLRKMTVELEDHRDFRRHLKEIDKSELKVFPHPGVLRVFEQHYLAEGDY